jgi:hypothetical protein
VRCMSACSFEVAADAAARRHDKSGEVPRRPMVVSSPGRIRSSIRVPLLKEEEEAARIHCVDHSHNPGDPDRLEPEAGFRAET